MKLIFRVAPLFILSALTIWSCAKSETEALGSMEQTSLNEWMKIYAPAANSIGNGMFIEKITSAPVEDSVVEVGNWVRIKYVGTALNGDVYSTRYPEVAKQQGTFNIRTHYDAQYISITDPNYSMIEGQYQVLRTMRVGDSVKVFMPSTVAYGSYGSSFSGGYQGQFSLSGNTPSILTLKLAEIVKDPIKRENKIVADYAAQPGWDIPVSDSIKPNLYFRVTNEFAKGDTITVDSTVNIYYIGKFTDGFVFDTNIDSVAQRLWNNFTTNKALQYKPSAGDLVQAFYYAVPKMRQGESAHMVFSSTYGYGIQGKTGTPTIQPYEPLVFEFFIQPKDKDKTAVPKW